MKSHLSSSLVLLALLLLTSWSLTGCGDIGLEDGARIQSVTVNPSTIKTTDTGMTDQNFTVTIVTAGFTEPLDRAEVFIEENNREAAPMNQAVEGETITLTGITLSWFSGLEAGDYSIGATVYSVDDLETATQRGLTTVTIEE